MLNRREIITAITTSGLLLTSGCTFSNSFNDFVAKNRTRSKKELEIYWADQELVVELESNKEVSRSDMFPDDENIEITAQSNSFSESVEYDGSGTVAVDIYEDEIQVGVIYQD